MNRKFPLPADVEGQLFLRQVIDLVPHYIFAKDTEGRFVLVNNALAEAYGSTPEEMLGKTDADFATSPAEAAHFRADDLEVIRTGLPKSIDEEVITDADGAKRMLQTTKIPFTFAGTSAPGLLGIAIDLTARKDAEQKIAFLAHHDHLTGLPNRVRLETFLTNAIAGNAPFSVLFIDLDHFKNINDSLGHGVGDAFLQTIATRLQNALGPWDFICRAGGDEFIVVLRELQTEGASPTVERLLKVVCQSVQIQSMVLSSSCSIGAANYPADGDSAERLMKHADAALYDAKSKGRNTYQFFTRALNVAADRRLAIYNGLKNAVASHEFELHYQPIVHASTGKYSSIEALIRWNSKELGMVSPAEFIPLAEDTGLVGDIGKWVSEQACKAQLKWMQEGIDLNISINVSAHQLLAPDFERTFRETCDAAGARLDRLSIELTEGVFLADADLARKVLTSLADKGVRISIDDFGVGYSSLNYLKRLPISYLKIDRSFVQDCTKDADDAAIVRTILALARNLSLGVVAEGVETQAQADFLQQEGCGYLQGYLFARPAPAREVSRILQLRDPRSDD